jgi:hypothetical protein
MEDSSVSVDIRSKDDRSESKQKLAFSLLDKITDTKIESNLFYKESVKGQTLLGLASFGYQPKPNLVDFIEDLGLAGVRFVYFSHAPQRESKAYAERMGLEIDWNSCIILSSLLKGGHGYLDDHDMKAKLPRGTTFY